MASSSNPPPPYASPPTQDLAFLYASTTNVSNFVSVKLSGDRNYHLWKAQMLCLMDTHNMRCIVDPIFVDPRASGIEITRPYESLLKGWIFGSVSEDVLGTVVDLDSAKDVWEKLKSFYGPTMSLQADSAPKKPEAKTETEDKYAVSEETQTTDKVIEIEIETKDKDKISTETKTEAKDTVIEPREAFDRPLAPWWEAQRIHYALGVAREEIDPRGNTGLHIAVGRGQNDFIKNLLPLIKDEGVLESRNRDGSTALHIAAIVGNKDAARLLVKKNKKLLEISDHKGKEPLRKAYENMHLDTILYLLEAAIGDLKNEHQPINPVGTFLDTGEDRGVDLLVNAISSKQYDLALKLVKKFPKLAARNDEVLMAIARSFPSGLDYWETRIYPSMDDISETIDKRIGWMHNPFPAFWEDITGVENVKERLAVMLLEVPLVMLFLIFELIYFLVFMVYFPFPMLYFLLWKVAKRLVAPIKHIEKKRKELKEAKEVLQLVCDEIDELELSSSHHPYYTKPVLEAACQNAYEVVDEILLRWPEAIRCTNKSGYDIFQLAVIHRSEKVYNLIYVIGECKSVYRTIEDSSKNNILHLAGRLAPSRKLKYRTGAALQLQRELQWREEVEKLVFPAYITRENIFNETPDMVFTKEHENLVKEGEKWMKTTAESCSITAALITTIVFAAAITVPGGSNQETGIPMFTREIAFAVFAISDAISLFTSSTALLAFLSILTARFAEQDFLVRLPRRLIIGLCALFLSTTAMMIAFGATLFLVFCDEKPWMLAPICGLACLPIGFFVTLQFPLIVDLFRSTYVTIFGKQSNSYRRKIQ